MDKVLTLQENRGSPGIREALMKMVERIGQELPDLPEPVKMYLAGGVAVNLYTGSRPTRDVDASFSRRLLMPPAAELVVPYVAEDGRIRSLYFDSNDNTTFAVMHENHEEDSWLVERNDGMPKGIELRILSPVDLVVSKLVRFSDNDRADITALAKQGLIYPRLLQERAEQALAYYVGRPAPVEMSLREALRMVSVVEKDARASRRNRGVER